MSVERSTQTKIKTNRKTSASIPLSFKRDESVCGWDRSKRVHFDTIVAYHIDEFDFLFLKRSLGRSTADYAVGLCSS